jgi:hypothetical protein
MRKESDQVISNAQYCEYLVTKYEGESSMLESNYFAC